MRTVPRRQPAVAPPAPAATVTTDQVFCCRYQTTHQGRLPRGQWLLAHLYLVRYNVHTTTVKNQKTLGI